MNDLHGAGEATRRVTTGEITRNFTVPGEWLSSSHCFNSDVCEEVAERLLAAHELN